MKKGLLGSTALIGATAIMAGAASAAEAPTYKVSGFMNFQVYITDQDAPTKFIATATGLTTTGVTTGSKSGLYFGTDDAEIHFNVSGTADNGLTYGFKIELEATQGSTGNADEARISLGGSWGTVLLGDEDGAEDTMNYGGETIMGGTGGFDGDQDDWFNNISLANSFPSIEGDTSDSTKITYYSPRFSGFQVGGSWTPNATSGDAGNTDTAYQNWIGLGANYDNTFNNFRVRASVVYASATYEGTGAVLEDISAFSIGGIVGFQGFSVAANWTDNGESRSVVGLGDESTYWNVAGAFEAGPHYIAVGYMEQTVSLTGLGDDTYEHLAITYDYSVAPGLGVYLEYNDISSNADASIGPGVSNDGSGFIIGTQVSF